MRKSLAAISAAMLILLAAPAAASAAPVPNAAEVQPEPVQTDDGYTPTEPRTPTLAGSTAVGECEHDVPWIHFSVTLVDPDSISTGHTARLVLSDGTHSTTVELGELQDNHLEGSVLWPGASVDSRGVADGWPGWEFVGGQWVETDGNFRWTRGAITASIQVNPELAVALSYPPTTPLCATDPRGGSLPATGVSAAVVPLGIAGGVIVVLGVVLVAVRRRARGRL
ncbi:LPXTG cell wall anchor domain-containing protein [Microbacterium ulmi]|uniref:LPXTG cell wall anchor domain-containing protein n=1 Tax=Microbacterium ulmi TaxID=179095 RepID=A0A7Y2PZJ5_9MICO|nr:LPXTG cell wall anchor domain-containing protein [Microbacterium ulmi]NII71046.1 LPXTG-motif cell wall-anchored protein [Microbacterium ulmi]NNH02352.1 LPXTG cell wall anchor domain-containing protein [Microbacterium ulmi]